MANESASLPREDLCTAPRDGDGVGPQPRGAFVGRAAELAELSDALDAAARGHGRLLLVSGEPGIGKTRLAWELTRAARARGVPVYWGRCWESGGAPSFWPWVEVLRQILAPGGPAAARVSAHAGRLSQLLPELAHLGGDAGAATAQLDPESARFLLFDAVASLLRERSAADPVVVIVDDLHAADRASLLLLAFLARALAEAGVLLVGTYRDLEVDVLADLVEPLAELGRHARRLSLRGLAADDVRALIEQLTQRRPSGELVAEIHAATAGNPFFVDEILRLMVLEGRTDGAHGSGALAIPDSVREAVRRRLGSLRGESVKVLEIAAVAGRAFDVAVVHRAAGMDHMRALDALAEPIRRGLVFEMAGRPGAFVFRHALIRDVLYADLSPGRRVAHHLAVGSALEDLSRADPDRYVSELAHHFLAAAPCCADDRFVAHGMRAVATALARMAFEEAVALCERVLAALVYAPPDERRRAEILLALGEAKDWASDAEAARAAFEQAAVIARRLGDADLLARAALGVGGSVALKLTACSRCETAPGLLREALAGVPAEETLTRARLLSRLALHAYSSSAGAEARELSVQAVAAARASGDLETLALVLTAHHAVVWDPDHLEERCAVADELLGIANALGSREFAMRAQALRVTDLLEAGDLNGLDDAIGAHAWLAEQSGDPFERWANAAWRATRALVTGAFAEAQRHLDEAYAHVRTPGLHRLELNAPMVFASQRLLLWEACGEGDVDLGVVEGFRSRYPEMTIWRVVNLYLLTASGSVEEVRRELDTCDVATAVECQRTGTWLPSMTILAQAIERVGDRTRAAALYGLLQPYAKRYAAVSFVGTHGSVSRALGLLAATLGDDEAATRHFEAALVMNERAGTRPLVASTGYDFARHLARGDARSRERARAVADEALRLASALGMEPLARRAQRLAESLGKEVASPAPSPARGGVTLESAGAFWVVSLAGARAHVKDSRGLAYVAELVRHPRREIHVLELLRLGSEPGTIDVPSGYAHELLDLRARTTYRRRIDELESEIEAAEAAGDPEGTTALREEMSALERELSRAVGLGGRTRRVSATERARVNVTRTIRLALANVAAVAPQLGGHLARSVRTGTYCSYAPDRDLQGGSFAADERIVPRRFTPPS
jgi:tetratricopeptide (TPR) repeat protein